MKQAQTGDWVKIHGRVLESGQRSLQIPEDTKRVPLQIWWKGVLSEDANIGEGVTVTTVTGRVIEGELMEVNPSYELGYGETRADLLAIGRQVRSLLSEENS